jgi:hypothetical protein
MSEVMLSIPLPTLASRIPGRQAKTLPTVRELMAAQIQGLQAAHADLALREQIAQRWGPDTVLMPSFALPPRLRGTSPEPCRPTKSQWRIGSRVAPIPAETTGATATRWCSGISRTIRTSPPYGWCMERSILWACPMPTPGSKSRGGRVFDPVNQVFYDRAAYYRELQATAEAIYTRVEAGQWAMRTKHAGPWHDTTLGAHAAGTPRSRRARRKPTPGS